MIRIIPYENVYENQVQDLFDIPVSGYIALSLQRKPHSLLGAQIQTEIPFIYIAIDDKTNQVLGIFNIGKRLQIFDGSVESLPYFCDLRIIPSHQNGRILLAMIRYVSSLNLNLDVLPATTVVFSDNEKMIKIIEKRAKQNKQSTLPYYTKVTDIETFIFQRIKKSYHKPFKIRKATRDDIILMQEFYDQDLTELKLVVDFTKIGLAPYYLDQKIEDYLLCFKDDELVGLLGTWNTSAFKQTVVKKYHWSIKWTRKLYNLLFSHILGYPHLPKEGEAIKTTSIHSISIFERSIPIFQSLIQEAISLTNNPIIVTVDIKDPLYNYLSSLKTSIRKKGNLYLVTQTGNVKFNAKYVNIDVARI